MASWSMIPIPQVYTDASNVSYDVSYACFEVDMNEQVKREVCCGFFITMKFAIRTTFRNLITLERTCLTNF